MVKADENTIVVGVDGSNCSEKAIEWAISEAAQSNRKLLLINTRHWTSDAVNAPMGIVGSLDSATSGRKLLSRWAAAAKKRNVAVSTRVIEGNPAMVLTESSAGAAMLVVGAHGHRGITRALLGSVSKGCLQKATCPVVVLSSRHPS